MGEVLALIGVAVLWRFVNGELSWGNILFGILLGMVMLSVLERNVKRSLPRKPDIVTMAKGITSGYLPLAATAVRKEIYDSFKGKGEYDHFRHVSNFGGIPEDCEVGIKKIEFNEDETHI